MPLGGISWDESNDSKPSQKSSKKGNEPKEPVAKAPHKKAYHFVKKQHKKIKTAKEKHIPGVAGDIFDFLFAVFCAWLIIQVLGVAFGTGFPVVVIESESMEHHDGWNMWLEQNNLTSSNIPQSGGIYIGDIAVVTGDSAKDIVVGDVIVFQKVSGCWQGALYGGGEPIIHRVVGIADISDKSASTQGAVSFDGNAIMTPCGSRYELNALNELYSREDLLSSFPEMSENANRYRLFFTKGDNNHKEDQCLIDYGGCIAPIVSYPVHESMIEGRAKVSIPALGYVKLGLVCAMNYATGNACSTRCWWTKNHPNC